MFKEKRQKKEEEKKKKFEEKKINNLKIDDLKNEVCDLENQVFDLEEDFESRIASIKQGLQFVFQNDHTHVWVIPFKNMSYPGLKNLGIENDELFQKFEKYNQRMK